jgi:hypothetical protein
MLNLGYKEDEERIMLCYLFQVMITQAHASGRRILRVEKKDAGLICGGPQLHNLYMILYIIPD